MTTFLLRRKKKKRTSTFIFFGLLVCMLQIGCRSFLLQRRPFALSSRTAATIITRVQTTTTTTTTTRMTHQAVSSTEKNSSKQSNNKLVVVIAGPTATGKSDVAAKLCASEKGLIVSADSVQAYRGVQIGANKPTDSERKETPHILVDVADHMEAYNAAEWRSDAILAIQALSCGEQATTTPTLAATDDGAGDNNVDKSRQEGILQEIKEARVQKDYALDEPLLPVVCGGTMMYIQWLVHGMPDAMRPTEDAVATSIKTIDEFQSRNDFPGAVKHVASFGEIFESRIQRFAGEDWYRLRRTLEVALTVQEETDKEKKKALIEALYTGERQGSLESMGYDVRCFFLCPDDRMSHTRVIDERCEQMITRGLLKETADLSLAGAFPETAARAIGYRQTLDYLNDASACSASNDKKGFGAFLDEFTTATRRYSKKQMSWFRKDKDFMFIPVRLGVDKTNRVEEAADLIKKFCKLSREEFDQERGSDDGISAKCKAENAEQGKQMKFYQPERHLLKEGTRELDDAVADAVAHGARMQQQQESRKRKEVPS